MNIKFRAHRHCGPQNVCTVKMELSIDMYGSLQSALANTETVRRLGLICNAVMKVMQISSILPT